MKQAAVKAAPPFLPIPTDPAHPHKDTILGAILSQCALDSNAQILSHVLTYLFAPPTEEPAHHFEQPRWSSEHLAALNACDIWRSSQHYGFIDYAIAMHEAMQWPEPIWYGERPEKQEYFHPWNRPLNEKERLALPEMYARYYAKRVTDVDDGYQWLLSFASDSIKQPARDNTLRPCTYAQREELYSLRVHLLDKWRKLLPLTLWREPSADIRLLFETASKCLHGVLSFGQCTAGSLDEGELIEARIRGRDVLIDRLLRGADDEVLMRSVGEKGATHSNICQACSLGVGDWNQTRTFLNLSLIHI